MRVCAVVQLAATVAWLVYLATLHGRRSASVPAPNSHSNSEQIAACSLDTLPDDCLTQICQRAGPRPTLALYLTSRSLRAALQRAAHELRQSWKDDFSIRAPFPAVQSSPCDIVDEIPPNSLVLDAFNMPSVGRPLVRIGNRYAWANYRNEWVKVEHKLCMLDRNLAFIYCHRFGRQDLITAETSNTSPYYCIKDKDVIRFYDSDTAGEIYQFVCADAVSHSGDRLLCHNTERNEMRLYRIDFQSQNHSCLWTKLLAPVHEHLRVFIHQDAIVYDFIRNDFRHLSVLSADSGETQWQTMYAHRAGEVDICASESVVTVVRKIRVDSEPAGRIESIMLILHFDLHTGRFHSKDQLRTSAILAPIYCSDVVLARDEFMIWYMRDSKSLIIIDFFLGTVSISNAVNPRSIGVAFRVSPFGPIRVQLFNQPQLE